MGPNMVLKVSQGLLRGKKTADYYSFQGIPYAKPPLGGLRFKAPEPPENWQGIRDATQEGSACRARDLITNKLEGSEDCLFLNVYTPQIKSDKSLPVMFWIHGGGFMSGSGSSQLYGPGFLLDKGVVLVTINYRLGALGFLAFRDPALGVPGNAGLKDIVMALKWVQNNIREFSGDPKNVTIFGESSGGVAVHCLVLSPMAKGLFHKAIMQSGSALNFFSRGQAFAAHRLALELGIEHQEDQRILAELQKVPMEELVEASGRVRDSFLTGKVRPFSLVIEPKSHGAFMSEEPLEIMKSGRYNKVPMIMGYNSLEGIFSLDYLKNHKKEFLIDASLVPFSLNLRIGSVPHKKVAERIRAKYSLTGQETLNGDVQKLLKVYGHNAFAMDICRAARLHAKSNSCPIYFYRFDLDTELNMVKQIRGIEAKGAAHADDLFYLFNNVFIPIPKASSLEHELIQRVTTLWTNFATCGKPQGHWKPMTSDSFDYLSMENEGFRMLMNPEGEFVDFWEGLHEEHQVYVSKL